MLPEIQGDFLLADTIWTELWIIRSGAWICGEFLLYYIHYTEKKRFPYGKKQSS